MKKTVLSGMLHLVLSSALLFSIPIVAQAGAPGPGDLNYDRTIDLRDAVLALQILAKQDAGGAPDKRADVNGDFRIGMAEALFALQAVAELRTPPVRPPSWSRSIGYGDTYTDYHAYSIQQASDGGYVFVYETVSGGAGGYDFGIAKTDADGVLQWTDIWGGAYGDAPAAVSEWHGGGFLVAGSSYSFKTGDRYCDIVLLKLSAGGGLLWQRTIGGEGYDVPTALEPVKDAQGNPDGYLLAAYTTSFGAGGRDIWMLRLDNDGDIVWQKTYGGGQDEFPRAVKPVAGGGFILTADTQSFGAGGRDVWVLKLDANGTVEWERTYGGPGLEFPAGIEPVGAEAYVVGARTSSFVTGSPDNGDFWVFKIDADGDLIWNYSIGGASHDYAYDLRKTDDNGFIMAGWTYSFGIESNDALLIKLDANGTIQWQKIYNKPTNQATLLNGPDWAYSVVPAWDGGYVVAGDTDWWDAENRNTDIWIFKVDSFGELGCGIGANASAVSNGGNNVTVKASNAYTVSTTGAAYGSPAGTFSASHPETFVHCAP